MRVSFKVAVWVLSGALAAVWSPGASARETEEDKIARYRVMHALCLALEDASLPPGPTLAQGAAVSSATEAFRRTLAPAADAAKPSAADVLARSGASPESGAMAMPREAAQDFAAIEALVGRVKGVNVGSVGTAAEAVKQREALRAQFKAATTKLEADFAVDFAPPQTPDYDSAAGLYKDDCTSCHGPTGRADGPLAHKIHPPLASLVDQHMEGVAPFHVYNLLLLGRTGTAMPQYSDQMAELGLWSLAYYVVGMRYVPTGYADLPAAWRSRLEAAGLNLALLFKSSDQDLAAWVSSTLRPEPSYSAPRDLPRLLAALRTSAPYLKTLSRK